MELEAAVREREAAEVEPARPTVAAAARIMAQESVVHGVQPSGYHTSRALQKRFTIGRSFAR